MRLRDEMDALETLKRLCRERPLEVDQIVRRHPGFGEPLKALTRNKALEEFLADKEANMPWNKPDEFPGNL